MSLVEIVETAINKSMDELAFEIEGELKEACPKRTGQTAASIHIESIGAHAKRIGSSRLSMLYADQGNGGEGRIITSTREFDRLGRRPGKLLVMNGMYTSYRNSVHGYEGSHFVRTVANRHR